MLAINLYVVDPAWITPFYLTLQEFDHHRAEVDRLKHYFQIVAPTNIKIRNKNYIQLEVGGLSSFGKCFAGALLVDHPNEAAIYQFNEPILSQKHVFASHVQRMHIFAAENNKSCNDITSQSIFISGIIAQCLSTESILGRGYCVVPFPHYKLTDELLANLLGRLTPFHEVELNLLEYNESSYLQTVTVFAPKPDLLTAANRTCLSKT